MGRRTGVGITAEGDMLAALNYSYGTDEATDFQKKFIRHWLYQHIVHQL
jgi:ribonucleoside-diphosphate reductase alpha chain